MRRSLQIFFYCTASGAASGALTGFMDGLVANIQGGAFFLNIIASSCGVGIIAGLFFGGIASLFAIGASLDVISLNGSDVRQVWPLRFGLLSIACVSGWLPFFFFNRLLENNIASGTNKVAATFLLFFTLVLIFWVPANKLLEVLSRRLSHILPNPKTSTLARSNIRWVGILSCAAFVASFYLYFSTQFVVAFGVHLFVGGWLFIGGTIAATTVLMLKPPSFCNSKRALGCFLSGSLVLGLCLFLLPLQKGPAIGVMMRHCALVPMPLKLMWRITDDDSDGFSDAFGGIDCDDSNAQISPLAVDIVQNGIDENCSGRDARALPVRYAPSRYVSTEFARTKSPWVIFVTSEALRFDKVDSLISSLPALSKLRDKSFYFTRAYSSAPATYLSLSGAFAGLYPSSIKWNMDSWPPREISAHKTITEAFKDKRYKTMGFVSKEVHENGISLKEGFDLFETAPHPDGMSALLVKKAVNAIHAHAQTPEPLFLWIHLNDPHEPYVGGYEQEIRRVDDYVGQLVFELEAVGHWENSVVVMSADHAEALHEHGVSTHSHTVYNSEIQIPLFIKIPGISGRDIDSSVSLVDLFPTLADLIELDTAKSILFDGISLLPLLNDKKNAVIRPLFSMHYYAMKHNRRCLAVIWKQWKLVRNLDTGEDSLFDLSVDPGEVVDISSDKPDLLESLKLEASMIWQNGTWK